jgi:hypothetical protein
MTTATKPAPSRQTLSFEECLACIPARDREAVIERAAIMEFEGGQTKAAAETNALLDWKRRKNT